MAGPMLRFHAGFQRTDMARGGAGRRVIGDAVQLGAQSLIVMLRSLSSPASRARAYAANEVATGDGWGSRAIARIDRDLFTSR
jgi:hypothetical protein